MAAIRTSIGPTVIFDAAQSDGGTKRRIASSVTSTVLTLLKHLYVCNVAIAPHVADALSVARVAGAISSNKRRRTKRRT